MKRIRALILALVLSISMLAPEFSMIPAAYAEDNLPAAELTDESAGAAAGAAESESAGSAAESGAASEQAAKTDAAGPGADSADPTDADEAGKDTAGTETQDAASETDPSAAGESGEGSEDAAEEGGQTEETAEPIEIDAYQILRFTELDDAKALIIPEELKDKITVSRTQDGKGILLKGTVSDLCALRIKLNTEFDFNAGSVGRVTFDGLKDKDAGMSVQTLIYTDDSEEPLTSIELKKQMGKKEWANRGDKTVSLGSADLSGKHSVSIGFNINGKDASKKTTVALRTLQFCKITVPVMYFNIDESEGTIQAMNASQDHSVECYGTVDLIVPDAFNDDTTFRDEYGKQKSIEGLSLEYIRGRGNSTWMDENKKPYKVKFAKAQNLFGFGKNKHWVLLANRYDNSLIRNRMTYWLGQQLGMEYTPQCVPVEVVMNGEFYGSYLLCEQIRIGEGRVSIDDLDKIKSDSPEVTDEVIRSGGYLLSLDFEEDEDRQFETKGRSRFFIESPDDNVKLFSDYIKAFTQKVEDAISGSDYMDADGHPYTEYLDLDSAVDYWWIQEFSANGDAYGSGSTYLYKKRDSDTGKGKLYWGPLWDFDYVAWGDLDYGDDAPDGLDNTGHNWFNMMMGDPEFVERLKTRWAEEGGLRDKLNEITREGGLLDRYIAQMETSYSYDHELHGPFESKITEYKGEIEQLREWIISRQANVEASLEDLKVEPHTVKFMIDGKMVKKIEKAVILREGDFPEAPKKKGKIFYGWENEDGITYDAGYRLSEDLVLKAAYINESEIVKPKKIVFKAYDVYQGADFGEYDNDDWFWVEYEVLPEDSWATAIKWTSSNESVAVPGEYDGFKLKGYGDTTLTATLENGVSRSMTLHVVPYDDLEGYSDFSISKSALTLKEGQYHQLLVNFDTVKCDRTDIMWISADGSIAEVDDFGVVTGRSAGTTEVMAVDLSNREVRKCKVTVKSPNVGKTVKRGGNTYKITSDTKGNRTCTLVKAKNAASVTIPATISYRSRTFSVTRIQAKAFAKSKARRVTIKTKKLTKAGVKGSLKGSKVKRIYVKAGNKKTNKAYMKKYRKLFTKKNAGRYAKVMAK